MTKIYVVKAPVVKVAIGPANGNRVARIIKRGGVVPEGVDKAKLNQLVKLGLIQPLDDPSTTDAETEAAEEAKNAAEAEAKAAEEAKNAADKQATAKTSAATKTTVAK